MEYMPVGKKESDSCSMLKSAAFMSRMPSSSVLMNICPLFWLKDHFSLGYLQMIQKPAKDLFEHLDFRICLYRKIDLSSLNLEGSMQIPDCVPDRDWHLDSIMFMNIVLDPYYRKIFWFKLHDYHLVICNHEDISMPEPCARLQGKGDIRPLA